MSEQWPPDEHDLRQAAPANHIDFRALQEEMAASDLPRGIYDIEVDLQAGMVRIVGHDGNTTGWRHASEYAAQFAFGSDDPSLGPDAARWTPEDDDQ